MNFGTMVQDILETVKMRVASDNIRHHILTSCRFHREQHYFFSEREFSFDLTVGRGEYRAGDGHGLPSDLVEILGRTLFLTPPGGIQGTPVERGNRGQFQWNRNYDTTSGEPILWDWFSGALRLHPAPSQDCRLTGNYLTDVGVPVKRYKNGAWVFLTPDERESLTDDFSNHWFDPMGGYDLVKQRALSTIYSEYLRDVEGSQRHQVLWLETKARLEDESEGKIGPTTIQPSFW